MQADNREQLIASFLTRVKLFKEDGPAAQKFLRDAHTFSQRENGNSDDEDIGIDFDNISEASVAVRDILKTLEDHYSDDSWCSLHRSYIKTFWIENTFHLHENLTNIWSLNLVCRQNRSKHSQSAASLSFAVDFHAITKP